MFDDYNDTWFERLADKGFPIIVMTLMALGGISILIGAFDMLKDYQSQPAQYACAEKGMDYRRRTFTTNVICTRRISHGADTIYVK